MNDVVAARNDEFLRACKALGVHQVYIANDGGGYDETILSVGELQSAFKSVMSYFASTFPAASHKTMSGNYDVSSDLEVHPTHKAATDAMLDLYATSSISDVRLYRDYIYYFTPTQNYPSPYYYPQWSKLVSQPDKEARQSALDQYCTVDANAGRYGLGWHASVEDLFVNSYHSNFEYLDFY